MMQSAERVVERMILAVNEHGFDVRPAPVALGILQAAGLCGAVVVHNDNKRHDRNQHECSNQYFHG